MMMMMMIVVFPPSLPSLVGSERRKSGKPILSYLEIASEKEYLVASACGTVYATPQAYISLRGTRTGGQYLR